MQHATFRVRKKGNANTHIHMFVYFQRETMEMNKNPINIFIGENKKSFLAQPVQIFSVLHR